VHYLWSPFKNAGQQASHSDRNGGQPFLLSRSCGTGRRVRAVLAARENMERRNLSSIIAFLDQPAAALYITMFWFPLIFLVGGVGGSGLLHDFLLV
jgi:hypothetical protein